jgi:hypothetical protein
MLLGTGNLRYGVTLQRFRACCRSQIRGAGQRFSAATRLAQSAPLCSRACPSCVRSKAKAKTRGQRNRGASLIRSNRAQFLLLYASQHIAGCVLCPGHFARGACALAKSEKRNGNGDALIGRLIQLAKEEEDRADWRSTVLSLKREGRTIIQREEELLRAAQAMRDAGVIDMSESHYLVSRAIISIAEYRIFAERTSPPLQAITNKEDVDPQEAQELESEFDRVSDAITAATFEEFGEAELAAMLRHDRRRFDERYDEGERRFRRRKSRRRRFTRLC